VENEQPMEQKKKGKQKQAHQVIQIKIKQFIYVY
jgi:hypothetical protein